MVPAHIAAAARGFDPEVCAAIVAVESGPLGPFGPDGRPIILYEPHVAWRVAREAVRPLLRDAGLAYPRWEEQPYPASQRARWEMFDGCADIAGRDVAIQACSWGLAQVLGENWQLCGYASPADFERAQATEAGQVETFIRYLEGAGLSEAIRTRNWTKIARKYNGPRHAEHNYAGRMEAEYRAITGHASPQVLRMGDSGAAVKELQRALGEEPDGSFGPHTRAAVETFQRGHGLKVDGVVGPATWAKMRASGETTKPPPAQAVPTPKADWTDKVAKGAGAVAAATAAAKGLVPDEALPALAAIDPLALVGVAGVAGATVLGAMWIRRRRRTA